MDVTIAALGKPTQDVFLRSARDFAPHPGPVGRMIALPLGAKLDVDELVVTSGGNAANAATTFARQGLRSVFLWALGEDGASESILEALRDEGVDVSHVLVEPGRTASRSVVLLAPTGERVILNDSGSAPSSGAPLDLAPIASADWLYLSSVAGDMRLLTDAVTLATAAGTRVLINPARSELLHLRTLLPLVARCDVVAVNAEEARLLLGTLEQDPHLLAQTLARYGPAALVTDGPRGAVFCDRTRIVSCGVAPATVAIDSTGCGDAFASGFLTRFAQGEPVPRCMAFAAANAAAVLGALGARSGILRTRRVPAGVPVEEWPIQPALPSVRSAGGPKASAAAAPASAKVPA